MYAKKEDMKEDKKIQEDEEDKERNHNNNKKEKEEEEMYFNVSPSNHQLIHSSKHTNTHPNIIPTSFYFLFQHQKRKL